MSLAWQDRGDCRGIDAELFFAGKDEWGNPTRQAKKVCAGCPVRTECLQYALDNGERFGVWGGTTWQERRRMLLQRRKAGPVESAA